MIGKDEEVEFERLKEIYRFEIKLLASLCPRKRALENYIQIRVREYM